jgi:hypothetical protein
MPYQGEKGYARFPHRWKSRMCSHPMYCQGYVVTGVYSTRRTLDSAVQLLKLDGFTSNLISMLGPSDEGIRINVNYSNDTKAPEGAAFGGAVGLMAGGVAGYLIPLTTLTWSYLLQLGQLGSWLAVMAGAGIGVLFGMISGGILGIVQPEHTIHISENPRGAGPFLLAVRCEDADWCDKAEDIFEQTGAHEVSTTIAAA